MADNGKEELNNKKEQARVEQNINNILTKRQEAYQQSIKDAATFTDLTRQITEDIKDQMGMTRAKGEADKDALSLARELARNAQVLTSTLDGQAGVKKQLIKDERTLQRIQTEAAAISGKIASSDEKAAESIAKALLKQQDTLAKLEEAKKELQFLDGKALKDAQKNIKNLEQSVESSDVFLASQEELLKNSEGLNREDIRRLTQLKQQEILAQQLIEKREHELEIQKKIEARTGVTGALVEGVGGIMQRLGMRSGIFQTAMSEASDAMKEMAEETERGGKNFTKAQIALKGMTKLAKGFGQALTDPLAITLAILDGFFKVDAATTKVQRLTGQNSMELAGMNDRLATSVDFLEVTAELTEQMGMNAQNAFSPNIIAQAAELKNVMGLAANEAAGLATIAQTTVGDVDGVTESVVGTTSAFNKANRSAVSQGVVLKDVATAAADIKASFAGNPEQLAQAAAAARRMGLELSKVDQIASSLMDFESSIEAELEAQLLTGKNINMAKARELALNNDLAGLGNEIFKNSADINEFGKMNRIQQEAQAKALGLSREELGKIAYARAIEAGMTEEAAEAAAGVTAEDMKRLEAQEAIQLAVAKLQQAFAPMLSVVSDIAQGIASFITPFAKFVGMATSTPFGKLAVGAAVLLRVFGGFNGIIGGVVKGTQSMIKGFGDYVSKVKGSKGILEKAKSFLGIGNEKATTSATKKLSDSAKKIPKGAEGAGKGTSSITNAIQKIDPKKLIAGAGAMLIAAGAVFVFAKAAQEFGKTDPGAILAAVGSMFALVGAVALLSTFVSGPQALALLAGAAAMLIVASALFVLGKAVQEIGKGMKTLGEGISGELIENLFKLGPALLSAAKGIALFGAAMALGGIGALIGGGMIGQLETLASLASPLSSVGTSLTAIAAGISAIALALQSLETEKLDELKGLVMTTALAAPMVAAAGAISSMVQGITGAGEGDSNSELLAEIKALRAVVEKGGTINMDGNKVGQYIMLSANKSA